jgi:hypothetical protein
MKTRALLCAVTVGVLGSAGPAAADVLVSTPPSPVAPPESEWLVSQSAPVSVEVLFSINPGPPQVFTNPGPPN